MTKVHDLKEGREIIYGYLGARVSTPTARQRRSAGVNENVGVTIEEVESNSPGDGQLISGDVVMAIDDAPVTLSDDFVRVVGSASVSRTTKFTVRRDGATLNIPIQLRQRQLPSVAVNRASQRIHWHGMLLGPIPANWKGDDPARAGQGLLVISANSEARQQGIRVGAIVSSVAGKTVSSVTELQSILNDTPPELCRIEFAPQTREAVAGAQ
jgi:S1-C subfamily serine protease